MPYWNWSPKVNPKAYDYFTDKMWAVWFIIVVPLGLSLIWFCIYFTFCVPFGAPVEFWPWLWSGIKFYAVIGAFIYWLAN